MLFDNFFYQYIDADPEFNMDTSWAYNDNALERKKAVANRMKELGLADSAEPDWYEQNFVPNKSLIDIVDYFNWMNPSTIPVSIKDAQQIFYEKFSITAPNMFNAVANRISYVYGSMAIMVGESSKYTAHKHFHPRAYDESGHNDPSDCRTVTVVIPHKINNPVTETVCFNPQTFTREEEDELKIVKLTHARYEKVVGEVYKIKMPDVGQYLIFDFNSSAVLHWTEQEDKSSTNEFLCILFQLPMKSCNSSVAVDGNIQD